MKELKVLKPFPYQGKQRKVGERISATNRHAAVLTLSGKAKEVHHKENPGYATRVMTPTDSGAPVEGNRRQRRGGRGGRGNLPVIDTGNDEGASPSTEEGTRDGYSRADMAAE